jgi:undecaprenyl-phosphate galactose phosphotransferase
MPDIQCELNKEIIIAPVQNKKITTPLDIVHQNLMKMLSVLSLLAVDISALAICIWLGYQIRSNVLPAFLSVFPSASPPQLEDKIWWIFAIVILCIAYEGLYAKRLSFWQEARRILSANTLAFMLIFAIVSLAKMGDEISRTVLVICYLLSVFVLPFCRYIGKYILANVGIWNETLLILGTGEIGKEMAEALTRDRYLGYTVRGFLKNNPEEKADRLKICDKDYPVLGVFKDAARIISSTGVRKIIIAAPELPGTELVSLTNQLQRYTRSILLVPDLFGIPALSSEIDCFFDEKILAFSTRNNLASRMNIFIKYLFEIFVGAIIFILLIPVMLIIAIAIKIDSPGPIGYSHKRIGHKGKEFDCYKFRTMVVNADELLEEILSKDAKLREEWKQSYKLKDDPRVTRIGRILRKSSLDELPQIINVIKGDMSLVGPRPIVEEEIILFGDYARDCFMVRPGMTGLWAISGRSDMDYDERARMEAWYIHNWSLWLDISILFRTIPVVFNGKGAY